MRVRKGFYSSLKTSRLVFVLNIIQQINLCLIFCRCGCFEQVLGSYVCFIRVFIVAGRCLIFFYKLQYIGFYEILVLAQRPSYFQLETIQIFPIQYSRKFLINNH